MPEQHGYTNVSLDRMEEILEHLGQMILSNAITNKPDRRTSGPGNGEYGYIGLHKTVAAMWLNY